MCACVRAHTRVCNYTPRLEMTGKEPLAPGNKRIGAEEGREEQKHSAQVYQPKASGTVLDGENKELGRLVGQRGMGTTPCSRHRGAQ